MIDKFSFFKLELSRVRAAGHSFDLSQDVWTCIRATNPNPHLGDTIYGFGWGYREYEGVVFVCCQFCPANDEKAGILWENATEGEMESYYSMLHKENSLPREF